jgi:hypothetical protein
MNPPAKMMTGMNTASSSICATASDEGGKNSPPLADYAPCRVGKTVCLAEWARQCGLYRPEVLASYFGDLTCMSGPQSQASAMSLVRHKMGSSLMASIKGGRVSGVPVGTPMPPSCISPAAAHVHNHDPWHIETVTLH